MAADAADRVPSGAAGRAVPRVGDLPPAGHPLRFTTIGHARLDILGPIEPDRLDRLVDSLALARGCRVFEIGCGTADLLVRILRRFPGIRALGLDRNPWFLARGRATATAAGVADRLDLREGLATADAPVRFIDAIGSADVAIAIGATGILGGQAETLAALRRLVRPRGTVIFGDLAWRGDPRPDGLAEFGMAVGEAAFGVDGFGERAAGVGLVPLAVEMCSCEAFEAYEATYLASVEDWILRHPGDPDAPAFATRVDFMRATWQAWRRDAMGFVLGRFRAPD